MPAKKKVTAPPPKPRRRIGLWIALILTACLALFIGWMHLNARILHVRYAEVHIGDLPPSFDGTTILFASDIDLCGVNTVAQADRLFDRLQSLQPDLLLLGGDYACPNWIEMLNGETGAEKQSVRAEWFQRLSDFEAPLGKLAVSGDNDGDPDALREAMAAGGVQLIDGGAQIISNATDAIAIAGIGTGTANVSEMASHFSAGQCVIALMHTPERIVDVRVGEAADGGAWADLALAGHTHGGQLQITGRTALSLSETEKRYLSGWYTDGTAPLLVTEGVGCEGANFRLGTKAEVWLITLRTGTPESEAPVAGESNPSHT